MQEFLYDYQPNIINIVMKWDFYYLFIIINVGQPKLTEGWEGALISKLKWCQ